MLLQSAAIGAKTLLLDDKEICLLGVVCKVSSRKTLSGETFYFPEKRLLSTLHFVLPVTYFFFVLRGADWPTHNFLGMYCHSIVIRLVNFV